jgi:hypothetical protein
MTKTKAYVDFILTELRKGNVQWSNNVGLFMGKYGVTEETFRKYWNIANETFKIEQDEIINIKAIEYKSNEIEAFKTQIRSKTERLISYQVQIEHIEKELVTGKTKELISFKDGKAQMVDRDLTVFERNSLRKTLKELQAEISKIEGDYAPKQIEMIEGINIIIE